MIRLWLFAVFVCLLLLSCGATARQSCLPPTVAAVCEISPMVEGRLRFDCLGKDGKIYTMIHSGGA
jgi:hypothetical protein